MKSWILLSALAFLAPGKTYAYAEGKADVKADVYQLLEIEDHREGGHPFLQEALSAKNPQLTARVLLALGRIGEAQAAGSVAPFLQSPHSDVRMHAAFALGLIKNPESLKALQEALTSEKEARVRQQIYAALGRLQMPGVIPILEAALTQENHPAARTGVAMAFCFLFLAPDAANWAVSAGTLQTLLEQVKSPPPLGIAAAWALARYKGEPKLLPEEALLQTLAETKEPEVKAIALKTLLRYPSDRVRAFLIPVLLEGQTHNMRIEAASALAVQAPDDATMKALLQTAAQDMSIVRAAALTTLAALPPRGAATPKTLQTMTHQQPSPWLQGKAYLALIAQLPEEKRKAVILEGLKHPDVYVQRELITQLPKLGDEGLRILGQKAADSTLLISVAAIHVLHELEPERMNASLKSIMLAQLSRRDPVITGLVLDAAGKFGWKDALPTLIQSASGSWKLDDYAVQENLMSALGQLGDTSSLPLIEKSLEHPVRNVVLKAAEAWEKVTGKKLEKALPQNNRVDEPTPAPALMEKALDSEVVMETAKGRIRIIMLKDAPITATKFVQWVQQGFYNGLNFHRVVPHWVVQGGDPRGDGEGGQGLIRDEVSMTPHLPYTLGIATAGKDTGSTQIFFNLGNNTRLDGSYTVFAQVIDGRDVVDRLELGDKIIKATVQPFRGL